MLNQNFLKTLNVLYVEDSKTIRTQFTAVLEKLFNNVITAQDGREGLNKFLSNIQNKDFEIHIIISDINMPNMDGIELLEEIRKVNIDIPFIFTTAYSESEYLMKAIKFNATDYVIKPVNIKELILTVQKVCQHKYFENLKKQTQKDLEELTLAINEVALVIRTDINGNIKFANKCFSQVCGYVEKELIGKNHKIIQHPDVANFEVNDLWEQIEEGKVWEGKSRCIAKNNEEFYINSTVIPLYDSSDSVIIEYMWISFLTTHDELEQNEFKKKVIKNVKETKKLNSQTRQTIESLEAKLLKYKHFDFVEHSLEVEKKRSAKFFSQTKYYEKEICIKEQKLTQMSDDANIKIQKASDIVKDMKEKKDLAFLSLETLTQELDLRTADVKELQKEVNKQLSIINELKESIEDKENLLGLNH